MDTTDDTKFSVDPRSGQLKVAAESEFRGLKLIVQPAPITAIHRLRDNDQGDGPVWCVWRGDCDH